MSETDKKTTSTVDRIYDLLSSIKLSIFVLIALALTSIIGTVLQQGKEAAVYIGQYGEMWGNLFITLGFDDMYHAWWFMVLLALLMVNITFCSLKRMPGALRQMKDRDPLFDKRDKPVAIHQRWKLELKGEDAASAMERAAAILSKKAGSLISGESDGAQYRMSSMGSWARMGVYVTHFSLFLFGLGAIIGLSFGFKGAVNIREGQTINEVWNYDTQSMMPLDFEVRCDHFEVTYYENSMRTKDYTSMLTVIEDGKELYQKRIEVNHPLIHDGIYFYQSSFGKLGLKTVKVSVAGPDRKILVSNADLPFRGSIKLPDGTTISPVDVWEDPRGQQAPMGVVFSMSNGSRGRAFEQSTGRVWWPVGSYQVRLDYVDWLEYTGLQVALDPGVPVVWAGCILITLGLIASFFFSHRRVWLKVSEQEGKVELMIAGNASRNRVSFENWFEDLCEEVQEAFQK